MFYAYIACVRSRSHYAVNVLTEPNSPNNLLGQNQIKVHIQSCYLLISRMCEGKAIISRCQSLDLSYRK